VSAVGRVGGNESQTKGDILGHSILSLAPLTAIDESEAEEK
jgi:hypothetical protein